MNTTVISKIGNFRINIISFWDCKTHKNQFQIKETGEVFLSQDKAMRRAKQILKKKRDAYYRKYRIVKRRRTKTIEITKPIREKNVWYQLNIANVYE